MPWTANDMGDLSGRTAVVTGANSGLGLETALELARHGATVVMACRNLEKGAQALAQVKESGGDGASLARLDLADLASVREFAREIDATHPRLDMLINNAGVMAIPHRTTADGFEMQLGTNHLGHFALTGLLLETLVRSPGARIVNVSSMANMIGYIRFGDLQSERRYSKWLAYGQSKLANLLFTFEMDRRIRAAGKDLASLAAHPGYAHTNLMSVGPEMAGATIQGRLIEGANRLLAQSAAQGALPTLYAATDPKAESGEFIGPVLMGWGPPARSICSPAARSASTARRLWEVSEELTQVSFDALRP